MKLHWVAQAIRCQVPCQFDVVTIHRLGQAVIHDFLERSRWVVEKPVQHDNQSCPLSFGISHETARYEGGHIRIVLERAHDMPPSFTALVLQQPCEHTIS